MNQSERIRRFQVKQEIESRCVSFIEEKIDRYLEIEHQWVIGDHHFAPASSECIYLYRDGYFIGAVMMSHSINEGIIKFVAERNGIKKHKIINDESKGKTIAELIGELQTKGHISQQCASASKAVWESYRNDIHHMNPKVATIPFQKLAQSNIKHLSAIEKELFSGDLTNGIFIARQPKYYDKNSNGTTNVFLRLE